MVKLIASDLDGTLLQNGAHDVNPIVFDQIRTLKNMESCSPLPADAST